jgi:hypothetical protein
MDDTPYYVVVNTHPFSIGFWILFCSFFLGTSGESIYGEEFPG